MAASQCRSQGMNTARRGFIPAARGFLAQHSVRFPGITGQFASELLKKDGNNNDNLEEDPREKT
ncbi:MAG TPA: hypothetical protein GYA10_14880 [Alphaproteobacteria bacterium]|nr:hypothetical protein [Alphaproteobacteria bacterium]